MKVASNGILTALPHLLEMMVSIGHLKGPGPRSQRRLGDSVRTSTIVLENSGETGKANAAAPSVHRPKASPS
jgi:hypothetical protein